MMPNHAMLIEDLKNAGITVVHGMNGKRTVLCDIGQLHCFLVSRETPDRIESLEAKLAEAQKDAERYRFLRGNDFSEIYYSWVDEQLNTAEMDIAEFDAAVDAALNNTEQEKV